MSSAGRKAVFLDRDGVINETVLVDGARIPPRTVNEFRLIDGVADAVERLRLAGFTLIVVTNQPDVARGNQSTIVIDAMHEILRLSIAIDDIVTCVHDDADACDCRKPKPGMLTSSILRYGLDASRSYMVGDRWRDVTAGRLAGCTTILVGPDWESPMSDAPDLRARDLREAAEIICQSQRHI